MAQVWKADALDVRQRPAQAAERHVEICRALCSREQQHARLQALVAIERVAHLLHDRQVGVQRRNQRADRDIVPFGSALPAHRRRERWHEHEAGKRVEDGHERHALQGRDERGSQLAAGDLLLVARHPVRRCRSRKRQRRLVERDALQCRRSWGGAQRHQRAGAEAENVAHPGLGDERLHVLGLSVDAEGLAVGTAEAAAAPIGHVDGEGVRQARGQFHQILGGLHAAMQKDDPGPMPKLPITDRRSVLRSDGVLHVRTFSCGHAWCPTGARASRLPSVRSTSLADSCKAS